MMGIPLYKLQNWAKPGKNEMSKDTYAKMRNLIENNINNVEIFLQGSYANSTNVRDNSDIDIVVILKDGTYDTYNGNDVRNARDFLHRNLHGKNNFQFEKGKKTVKYKGNTNYVPADLVPSVQYDADGHEGIVIYDHGTMKYLIGYPKQHKANGEAKSGDTDGNFKKAVRMFKNVRNYAVDKRILSGNVCPSYFIECLLYNVKDSMFSGNEQDVFFNVMKALYENRSSLSGSDRMNGIQPLFEGDNSWNVHDACQTIEKIAYLWENWGRVR